MNNQGWNRAGARAWAACAAFVLLSLLTWCPTRQAEAQAVPIALEVRANPDPAAPGDIIRYTVHLANSSATTPSGAIVLRANIPQYATVEERPNSYTASGTRFGSYVEWRFADLAPGESYTRQLTVRVDNTAVNPPPPDGTVLTLEVTATASGTTYTKSASTVVRTAPLDFDLSIQQSQGRVAPGATLVYELRFANIASSARPAVLRVPVPAGTTFVSASEGGLEQGGAAQWDLGTLSPGFSDRRFLALRVAANAQLGTFIRADAELKGDAAGPSLVRVSEVALVAANANLQLHLAAAPDPVSAGERLVYKLFVSNRNGNTPSGDFEVVVNIPKKATVVNRPGSYTASGTRFGNYVLWRFSSLEPGASDVVQFTVELDNSAAQPPPPDGTLLVANAYVNGPGATSASCVVNVESAPALDLALGLESSVVAPGANLTYRLSFGNAGSADIPSVLRLPVPEGTSFVSATGGGTEHDGVVEWPLGSLAHEFADFRTATFKVADGSPAGTFVVAEAELRDDGQPGSLVRRKALATVAASNTLSLAVSATPELVVGGSVVIYKMVLTNTSEMVPTEALELTVNIPEYATVTERPGSYTASGTRFGDTITYRYASLAPRAVAMSQFTVTIDSTATHPPPRNGTVIHSDVTVGRLRFDTDLLVGTTVGSGEPGGGGSSGSDGGAGTGGADAGAGGADAGAGGADAGEDDGSTAADPDAGPDDGEDDGGTGDDEEAGDGGAEPAEAAGCSCSTAAQDPVSSLFSTLLGVALVYGARRRRRPRALANGPA